MNSIVNLIWFAVIFFTGFTLFAWIGFRVRPRLRLPELNSTRPLQQQNLSGDMPAVLKRWLQSSFEGPVPVPATAIVWGRGKMIARQFGKLGPLWVPTRWTLYLKPGETFVTRQTVTWFTMPMMQGGDEFRQGKGRFVLSKQVLENEHIDVSERVMMWLFTFLYAPAVLLTDERIHIEEATADTLRVSVPFGETQRWEFTLNFESTSGKLYRIDTLRPASRSGKKYPFQVRVDRLRSFELGSLPAAFGLAWENEYFSALTEIAGVEYNMSIAQVLEEGASETTPVSVAASEAETQSEDDQKPAEQE